LFNEKKTEVENLVKPFEYPILYSTAAKYASVQAVIRP
jgi:hypothetical protein